MSGETHAAVGAAAVGALTLFIPVSLAGVVVGVAGALFPDLDVKKSKANKIMDKALIVVGVAGAIAMLTGTKFSPRSLVGLAVLLGIGIMAKTRPHREFSHSLTIAVATSLAVWFASGTTLGICFLVGYLSHLCIDLLNTKGESLLWPLPGKWCLGLCKASGTANVVMKWIATGLAVLFLIKGVVLG